MEKRLKILGITAALLSAATFGMIPLFSIPVMKSGMSEVSVLFYRCLFSVMAVGLVSLAGRNNLRVERQTLMRLAGLSIIYSMSALALIYSYNYISSGVVTTIHFLYPVIVAIMMAMIYKEKISAKLLTASLVTLGGVACLSWKGDGFYSPTGIILALSVALVYATYVVGMNQKGVKDTPPMTVIFYIMGFCTVIMGTIAMFSGGISPIRGGYSWFNLVMLALLPTVVSNLTLLKGVKYAGATLTSILGSTEPIVAVIIGITVFSERLTITGIMGLVIILGAATYVILSGTSEKRTLPAPEHGGRKRAALSH